MSHSSHLQALHTGARYSFLILVITHYQLARVGLLPHISARVSMVVTEGFPFSRVGLRVDRHTPEFAPPLRFLQKPSWFFLGMPTQFVPTYSRPSPDQPQETSSGGPGSSRPGSCDQTCTSTVSILSPVACLPSSKTWLCSCSRCICISGSTAGWGRGLWSPGVWGGLGTTAGRP